MMTACSDYVETFIKPIPAADLAVRLDELTPIKAVSYDDLDDEGWLYHAGGGQCHGIYRWNERARPDRCGATIRGQFWTNRLFIALDYYRAVPDRRIYELHGMVLNRLIREGVVKAYWFTNHLDRPHEFKELVLVPTDAAAWEQQMPGRVSVDAMKDLLDIE